MLASKLTLAATMTSANTSTGICTTNTYRGYLPPLLLTD